MGKVKNKDDVIQYTFRLNLTNEDHLEVHQTLQNLNKGVHKSQNSFIIDSILRNIRNYTKDELLSDAALEQRQNEGFIKKRDLDEMEQRVTEKVMKEVVTLLCSSLVGRSALPAILHTAEKAECIAENEVSVEDDETLSSLSNVWS
ncbi:MAG TPA: hypothetical protein VJ888_10145 [Mobilitalea sp.]|nr:hypothetical protein [Mobilitalea sp.]